MPFGFYRLPHGRRTKRTGPADFGP
jgi:hypothetical protein